MTEPIEQLRKEYNELAALAGSLAHEIKNPLSIIRMNMGLLHEDIQEIDHPEARRSINRIAIIERQCERLEDLLNGFLRFNKLTSLDLKPGNLNEQVGHVLDFFESQAKNQHVEIERYLDAELPRIRIDSPTLQAALVNLVKNALEAMPEGGQLVARTRITRQGVALDFIDTGCGMTTNALINMFKEFYTSKDGGTGLGLPTTKKIVEAHGARIHVQSEVEQGTQITIEFPTPPRLEN